MQAQGGVRIGGGGGTAVIGGMSVTQEGGQRRGGERTEEASAAADLQGQKEVREGERKATLAAAPRVEKGKK